MSLATFKFTKNDDGTTVSRRMNVNNMNLRNFELFFQLKANSVFLQDNEIGDIFEQTNGKFAGLQGGKTYEVFGEPMLQTVAKIEFKKTEIQAIQNTVMEETVDMMTQLEGVALAPKAVSMINCLTILSACAPDPRLDNEVTDLHFKSKHNVLRTKTFKSALSQVINEAIDAFKIGDMAMSRIKSNLACMPLKIKATIEVASQPQDPAAIDMLHNHRESIISVAQICKEEAVKAAKAFGVVTVTVGQLIEVTTATKSVSIQEQQKLKALHNNYIKQKEALEEEARLINDRIKNQEKIVQDALDDAQKKSKTMGSLGAMLMAVIVDTAATFVKDLGSSVKGVTNLATSVIGVTQGKNAIRDDWPERTLLSLVEQYCNKPMMSQQELVKNAPDIKKYFQGAQNFAAVTTTGQKLQQITKNYVALLDQSSTPSIYQQLQDQFDQMRTVIQTDRVEAATKDSKVAGTIKAATGFVEQINNTTSNAQGDYRDKRDTLNQMEDKATEFRRGIAELQAKMENTRIEDLRLEDIIKYLTNGLMYLEEMRKSWVQQQLFFEKVENTISDSLTKTLEAFVKQQQIVEKNPTSSLANKMLMEVALKCCGVVLQVRQCATIYKDISGNFIMPRILSVQQNMHLNREEAVAKLRTAVYEFDSVENEVRQYIQENRGIALNNTAKEIMDYAGLIAITNGNE